jgi:hypothetical protein
MPNPFSQVIDRLNLTADAQGSGFLFSHLYCLLTMGAALHASDPTAWNARSLTAADEVLFRLRAMQLGTTFAYREIERFFTESVK